LAGTLSLSSGARSRDPLALPTYGREIPQWATDLRIFICASIVGARYLREGGLID